MSKAQDGTTELFEVMPHKGKEVEQGKLGKKVNVISNVEGVSLNKTSNILK